MPGILLATHGGESADGAVRVAASLSKRLRVALSAICVIEPRVTIDAGAGVPYMGIPDDAGEIGARNAHGVCICRRERARTVTERIQRQQGCSICYISFLVEPKPWFQASRRPTGPRLWAPHVAEPIWM